MRRLPERSVSSSRPSGRKASPHGVSRPLATYFDPKGLFLAPDHLVGRIGNEHRPGLQRLGPLAHVGDDLPRLVIAELAAEGLHLGARNAVHDELLQNRVGESRQQRRVEQALRATAGQIDTMAARAHLLIGLGAVVAAAEPTALLGCGHGRNERDCRHPALRRRGSRRLVIFAQPVGGAPPPRCRLRGWLVVRQLVHRMLRRPGDAAQEHALDLGIGEVGVGVALHPREGARRLAARHGVLVGPDLRHGLARAAAAPRRRVIDDGVGRQYVDAARRPVHLVEGLVRMLKLPTPFMIGEAGSVTT